LSRKDTEIFILSRASRLRPPPSLPLRATLAEAYFFYYVALRAHATVPVRLVAPLVAQSGASTQSAGGKFVFQKENTYL
jgi:hypothetical protein